ncbi:MAG: flagellar protein FlaG [Desulfocapsaceae bacterium]|nr:flagellar protein FlaG [Desulfocapsaceae bacterium]
MTNVAALSATGTPVQKFPQPSEQVDTTRKNVTEDPGSSPETKSSSTLHSEEFLKNIKAITENGTYSVNFETDSKTGKLVVKVVNTETQQVIRQIPPEDLLGLDQALTKYQGNFVNTKS